MTELERAASELLAVMQSTRDMIDTLRARACTVELVEACDGAEQACSRTEALMYRLITKGGIQHGLNS